MKFINDKILRDTSVEIFMAYGKDFVKHIKSLEARIEELEKKPKAGRPRKVNATNEA